MVRGLSSCPNCQAPTTEGQAFCTSCGAHLSSPPPPPQQPEPKSEAPHSGRATRKAKPVHKETLAGFRAALDEKWPAAPKAKSNPPGAPAGTTPPQVRADTPPNEAPAYLQPGRTKMYHSDSLQRATGEKPAPDTIGPRRGLQEHRGSEPRLTGAPVTVVTEGVESSPPVDESFATGYPPRTAPVSDRWRQDAPINASSFFRSFDEIFAAKGGSDPSPPNPPEVHPSAVSSASTSALRVKLPYGIAAIAATMALTFGAVKWLQPAEEPVAPKVAGQNDLAPVWARIEPDLSALDANHPAIRWRITALPGTTLSIDGRPIELGPDGRGMHTTDISDACTGPALAEVKMEKAIQYVAKRPEGPPQEDTVSVAVSIVPLELKQAKSQGTEGAEVLLKGRTAPQARLTIQGMPVPLTGGSFEKKLSVGDDVSEVTVRASLAGHAPRIVKVPVERSKRSEATP
jgi:hypothetical protein